MSDTDDLLLDAWRAFGKQYDHNGHNVFYREEGEGPVLLCIHGFPTASWDWHRIWGSLTSHYRVIAPDMLGFGFSDKPKQYDYTIADHTDLHEGLIENLGIDSVSILAHDMGDTVVQELLARDVDRPGHKGLQIRKVCLLNGGLFPETTRPRPIQKLLAGPLGGLVARMLNRRRFGASIARVFGGNTKPSNADLDANPGDCGGATCCSIRSMSACCACSFSDCGPSIRGTRSRPTKSFFTDDVGVHALACGAK